MQSDILADFGCHVGECPVWHPDESAIFWIDIPPGRVFRYRPGSGTAEQVIEGPPIRAITAERDGGLLVFEEAGTVYHWSEQEIQPLELELPYVEGFRFNDVAPGPQGRVFCGVMATEDRPGGLYRLEADGSMAVILDDVAFPNGLGFSPTGDRFYFTDTRKDVIYEFDYDQATGVPSNQRVFVDTSDDNGFPDGLAVDAEGHIWSTRWDGGRMVRYDPEGTTVESVTLPARKVTNLAFGGPGATDGFVTTALASSSDPIGSKDEEGDGAGTLLHVDMAIPGTKPLLSNLT